MSQQDMNTILDRPCVSCDIIAAPTSHWLLEIVQSEEINSENRRKIHKTGLDVDDDGTGGDKVILRSDDNVFYPVIDEFPVPLELESLISSDTDRR